MNRTSSFILALVFLYVSMVACKAAEPVQESTPTVDPNDLVNAETFAANQRLGRAVNLGNALEGPSEGAWGLYLKEDYFVDIAEAGFDSVRVPIRWSKYAGYTEPFTIQESIFKRVDWVIEQAFANDLAVVINIHHYEAMMQQPEIESKRLAAIWRQIAERYQGYPDTLYFEILNEPTTNLVAEKWNKIIPEALAAIRETNPERYVIIGPDSWNNIGRLSTLQLPEDDRRIIVTFHYYSPHEFTHQGASWSSAYEIKYQAWGSDEEIKALTDEFDAALAWSQQEQRPLFIGEFGSYCAAPLDSRVVWTSTVRAEAEKRGFSWAYWDFGTNFAVYNLAAREWHEPILRALIPED
jgi:endoglucanase